MYKKHLQGWMGHIDVILIDLFCLHFSFILAYIIKTGNHYLPYARWSYGIISIIMTMILLIVEILFDSSKDILSRGSLVELFVQFKQTMISLVMLTLSLFALQKGSVYSRIAMAYTYMLYGFTSLCAHILYKKLVLKFRKPREKMLVVTTSAQAHGILHGLMNRKYALSVAQVVGLILTDTDRTGGNIDGISVVANGKNAIEYAQKQWVDRVYIAVPLETPGLSALIQGFEDMGMTVHLDLSPVMGMFSGRRDVERLGKSTVLTGSVNITEPARMALKRTADIIGGLVGLVLTGLIAIVVIPLQQKASKGPVFFIQERIGKNGKHFKMYKFRSMCMDAEAKKAELMDQNRMSDSKMFKLDWDPRIIGNRILPDGTRKTGIGEFLRKTSLDEFPQFINILKGDMSLVGTRPPTLDEWEEYDPHHRVRMAMKPGLTGMWQVSGRSEITDFEEVVELDRYYIANWNIGLDIKILFKTVAVVLQRKGAM